MKKIFLLLSFCLLAFSGLQAQNVVQIGNEWLVPSSTLYSPLYRFSATSTTRHVASNIIFEQSELAAAGITPGTRIDSIAFQKGNTAASTTPFLFRMLVGTSTRTAPLPLTLNWDTVSAGKQEVLNNPSFTLRADTGWYVFNFTSPFTYTGGTLEIATILDYGTGASTAVNNFVQWRYSSGFAGHIIGLTSTAATYPTSTAMSGNVATYKHRPNIHFFTGASNPDDAALGAYTGFVAPMMPGTNQTVSLQVTNAGANTLSAVSLNYQLNQGPIISQSFATNLSSGASTTLSFSTPISIPAGQNFQLRTWISGINGGGVDANANNDTLVNTFCIGIPIGTVTVGGSGTFPNLQAALTQLSCGGVGGQVTVDILENQTGNFVLNAIPGSGNGGILITTNSQAVIGNAGGGSVLSLNGLNNVVIQNLIFERTAVPTVSNFLLVGDNLNNVTLVGNTFRGVSGSTSTLNNLVRFNNSQSIVFIQNQLRNGNVGYQANASTAGQPSFGHTVSNNTFENIFGSGIVFDGTGGSNQALVEGNVFNNTITPSTTADAIALTNLSNAIVRGNRVSGNIGRYGIHLSNYNGTSATPNLVVNNSVSGLIASTTGNALRLTSTGTALADRDFVRVVNNSFHMRTATTSTTASGVVFITGGTPTGLTSNGVIFQNNLVSIGHTGTRPRQLRMLHFSNRVYVDSSLLVFSNNVYNNGADSLVHIVSPVQTLANLAEWQALSTGLDQNSIAGDPQVLALAADDLRPTPSSPLINAGLFQADVTTDLTGAARDAQPDIGAFEFVSVLNSAAMVNVLSPSAGRLIPGTQPVQIRFANLGTNVINSIELSYQLGNATAITENWSGILNPGDSANYTFTTTLVVPNQINTNLQFRAWVANPNGLADADASNDTITRSNCIAIAPGTYTVGSASSTFPNVQSWVNYLNCAGISGPVTFQMDFTNNVHTAGTIRLINVPGLSALNTLELNGQGDTLRFEAVTGDRALIYLENTDHVTIRNFNLVSTAANFGFGIHLNGADSVRIIGNRIDLSAVTTTTTTQTNGIFASASPSAFTATTAQALFIDSNEVIGGNSGIRVVGNASAKSRNLYIGRNVVRDFYQNGIFLVQVDSALIENNDVNRAQRTGVTTFQGINLEAGAEGVMIRNNRIHSSHNSATARTAASFGVRISTPGTTTKRNYIVNNLIYGFSTTGNQNGILLNATNFTDVLFNTIFLNDTLATGNARAVYLQALNQNVRILNNNLVVNKQGSGEKQVLYLERDTTSVQINYNNYYTSSTTGIANILHFGTVGYASIPAWRAVYPQYDSLSLNGNPLFANISQADFSPRSAVLDQAGLAIPFVTTDFTGALRGNIPDIGAIEFTPPQNDLALVQILSNLNDGCVSSLQIPIQVRLTNIGNSDIDTVVLSYRINSQATQRDTLFTGITSGTILNYTFRQSGSFTNGTDTLLVIAKGTGDLNASNDTLRRVVTNFQATIAQVPYSQDFEAATVPMDFCMSRGDSAQVLIQGNAINNLPVNGSSSLVMMGSGSGTPWTAPTVTNWWTINPANLSEASLYVNVAGLTRLNLAFNLRQLFNTAVANNNFRVLVNGQQITAVGGISPTIRPVSAASSSTTLPLLYRLDGFLGGSDTLLITFQSSVRFNTANSTPNANAIDSLRLFVPTEVRFSNLTGVPAICAPGPQNISVTIDTVAAVNQVNLRVGAYGQPFSSIGMTRGSQGMWTATIPAQAVNRVVRYAVVVQDANGSWSSDTLSFENRAGNISLGNDQTITLGQQATLTANVQLNGQNTLRFTEFMHFKSPAANIQATWPTGVPNNADDMIELRNFGTDTVDLSGLRMVLFGATTRWTLNFPVGARVAPGRVAVILPGTGAQDFVNQVFYMGGTNNNVLTSTNRNGAVLIDTTSNALIDIFMTNDSILPPDLNLPASAWTGRINSSSVTGIRRVNANANGAAAWGLYSATDTTGFGYINPSLSLTANAAQINWFTGATALGTGLTRNVSPTATTTYRVEFNFGSCVLRDTVVVNVSSTPFADLLVSRIMQPVTGTSNITAPITPRIWIRNQGTAAANGFSVNTTVNGSSLGIQNFTQSIAANDSLEVSLNNWNPNSGTYEVCFTVNTTNDVDTTNNRRCVSGVQISNTTSVKEWNALGVSIYPNPANSHLNIALPDATQNYSIRLMDAAGRILGHLQHQEGSGAQATLDVQPLANGIYYLRIQNGQGQFSQLRFVVAR